MTTNIFLSLGRTATPEQETFVHEVERMLEERGMQPRTVGRTDFAADKPLQPILNVMKECSGALVIAYERYYIEKGSEFPHGENEARLDGTSLPTVWNQIEAAMAYALDIPLLTIAESRLKDEGILEEGYDWFVHWLKLSPEELQTEKFEKTFGAWAEKVQAFEKAK